MSLNPNIVPAAEAQELAPDTAASIGAVAIDVEEYVSPQFVAEVPAEVVTLGAVRGFEQEQTSGYKPMP